MLYGIEIEDSVLEHMVLRVVERENRTNKGSMADVLMEIKRSGLIISLG